MIDEEKVILMTRMASYEAGEGKKNLAIWRFFRGDYIGLQLLGSFICATLSFALGVALYVYYNFEDFMENLYEMDILEFAKGIAAKYVWFLVIYMLISYAVFAYRYSHARGNLKAYYGNLKKLSKIYKGTGNSKP